VHADLEKDQLYGTLHLFPELLRHIPILVYNGQFDLSNSIDLALDRPEFRRVSPSSRCDCVVILT
jgi:hypothetical protein